MNTATRSAYPIVALALAVLAGVILSPQNVARATVRSRYAPPAVTVSFRDLDLTTPQGTAILYLRIRNAARSVCGPRDTVFVEERTRWSECVDESIANAVAKVGNARLTAYHQARTGRHRATATAQIANSAPAR